MLFDLTFSCYLTTFNGKKCLSGKVICAFFVPLIKVPLYPHMFKFYKMRVYFLTSFVPEYVNGEVGVVHGQMGLRAESKVTFGSAQRRRGEGGEGRGVLHTSSSSTNFSRQSTKLVPLKGSPPMPTTVDCPKPC
jgi:hypothetical protein